MNKIILLIVIMLCSCHNDEIEKALSGKHELRKFNVRSTKSSEHKAVWFFVIGSYSKSDIEETKVRFYFKTNNGEYMFKETDFEDVNIKIDSTADVPYVKFYWINPRGNNINGHDVYKLITRTVIYCKEEDFQPEININQLR